MGKHKNNKQEATMLEFMMWHSDLAKGNIRGSPSDQLWKDLSKLLNNHAPPEKDGNGWKKVWSDWKWSVRKKMARNQSSLNECKLSKNEEALVKLCCLQGSSNNDIYTNDPALGWDAEESQLTSEEEMDMASTSHGRSNTPDTRKRKRERESSTQEIDCDSKSFHARDVFEDVADIEQVLLKDPNVDRSKVPAIDNSLKKLCDILEGQSKEQKRHNLEMETIMKEKLSTAQRRLKIEELRLNTFLKSERP